MAGRELEAPAVVEIATHDGVAGRTVTLPVQRQPVPTLLVGANASGKTSAFTSAAFFSAGAVGHALAGRVEAVAVEFADGSGLAVRREAAGPNLSSPFRLIGKRADDSSFVPGERVYANLQDVIAAEAGLAVDELVWRLAFGRPAEALRPDTGWLECAEQLPEWRVCLVGTARLGLPEARVIPADPAQLSPAALIGDTVLACRNDMRERLSRLGRSAAELLDAVAAESADDAVSAGRDWNALEETISRIDRFYDARELADFIDEEILPPLSAGQQHLFVLFYAVLVALPSRCVVLVDEPELSLHTAWCHPLLAELAEAAALRGSRIVAATHSAAVLNEWWDYAVDVEGEEPELPEEDAGGSRE